MASFIAPIIGGLAGLFGGGTQKKTVTNGTITNSGTSTSSGTSSNTPNLSPFQTGLANTFTKGLESQYNNAANLNGYTEGGLENINNSANLNQKILNNTLAARGQSFSPAATTAEEVGQQSRLAQGNSFLSQIPLLQQQLKQQALQGMVGGFAALPTGTTSTGNQTSTTNNTQTQNGTNLVSGNPIAGAISGIGSGLFAPTGPNGTNSLQNIMAYFNGGGSPTASGPSTNWNDPNYQP